MGITTKWPRLIVVGDAVTEAQADEILVRTTDWNHLFSNDRAWKRQVFEVLSRFGHPGDVWDMHGNTEEQIAQRMQVVKDAFAWNEANGILSLAYLHNDRVMSSWIGGPHGWCSWDGAIGTSNYNIGKWPSTEEVTEDWSAIAEAFPWLTLKAQCLEDEGEGVVTGQWTLENGGVTYVDGEHDLLVGPDMELPGRSFVDPERGIHLERLESALRRVIG